jgi:biotin synthase
MLRPAAAFPPSTATTEPVNDTTLTASVADMPAQTIQLHRPTAPVDTTGTGRWSVAEIEALFNLPFNDLLWRAQQVHRQHFDANEVQLSTLMSIKTGGCSEDCGYCPQSVHHNTDVEAGKLIDFKSVLEAASCAKSAGARSWPA